MHILAVRPIIGVGATVARFDVQITHDIRLYNLKLVDGNSGPRVYAPQALGATTATFSPAISATIASAAMDAYRRVKAGEIDAAA